MDILNALHGAIENGKITVIGIGISNIPLIDFLLSKGARVSARDKKSYDDLLPASKELEEKGVKLVLGENYLDNIDEDVIFRSPGIRPDIPAFKEAEKRGAVLLSEMELFFELSPAKIIGVTGSDGKTTTTTLIYKFLSVQFEKEGGKRKVYVGGNIGRPLLPSVYGMAPEDIAVVELSSFQLQTIKRSPWRAVITNITPNHLNWHTDMEEYAAAKFNICTHGEVSNITLNAENERTAKAAKTLSANVSVFSSKRSLAELEKEFSSPAIYENDGYICYYDGNTEKKILRTSDIKLPGRHNVENYMAAISATMGLVDFDVIEQVAKTFGGVEHRLEFVRELDGVKYYNSSIDSSPTRTAAALSSFSEKVVVICGGYDKNIPFEPLAKVLCEKAKTVILTGATAKKIYDALTSFPDYREGEPRVIMKDDFRAAVLSAKSEAKAGDKVILSPACASFDAFKNFEERGNFFKKIVNELD